MAKRELITREEAIKTVSRWIKADMTLGLSLFEMMMNEIPIITEQEIAKPYLKKLRAKINEEIDFEEKWLNDVFWEDKGITLRNIEIAMNGIRHVVKGELEE